jgi:hypothetical protein
MKMISDALKKKLNSCINLQEVIDAVESEYDLKTGQINILNRSLIISGLEALLKLTNPKPKKA